ncbi:MAG: hypothetical protein U0169_08155 [Polyangiaceae bacterium]
MKAITAGMSHTCALTNAGAVKCWGSNAYGQLGTGNTSNSYVPVDVVTLGSGVEAITAGRDFTCALLTTGAVKCWGGGANGQLGNGTASNSVVPVALSTSDKFASVVANGDHACGVREDGTLFCWGANTSGQNGNGTLVDDRVPTRVATTCTATSCSAGCCSAGRCMAGGLTSSCGLGGGTCSNCVGNSTCNAGSCGCTFPYTTCSTGCCLVPSTDGGSISPTLVAPETTGAVATGTFVLARANSIPRLVPGVTCPITGANGISITSTAALYVEVRNDFLFPKKVSIWTSQASAGPVVDTVMAVYGGATPPTTNAQRLQCLSGTPVSDRCSATTVPTACANDYAGIVVGDGASQGITIPGLGSVTVYVADYFGTQPNDQSFVLSVRTEP